MPGPVRDDDKRFNMATLSDTIKQTKPLDPGQAALLAIQLGADRIQRSLHDLLHGLAEITPVQYNVLRILRGAGESGRTCKEIAERLVTQDPDVTRLLDRLARRDLIERRRATADRRVVRVHLTANGRALIDRLDQPVAAHTQHHVRGIAESDLHHLSHTLHLIRDNAEQE